jgi:hypothetical protein
MLPAERWALTPPFHPYRNAHANRRRLAGLPASCHRAAPSGGLSFCGTIREQQRKPSPVLPLPWRYQARCPFLPAPTLRLALRRWCPDFPPACDCRELPRVSASQRSPDSPAKSIISRFSRRSDRRFRIRQWYFDRVDLLKRRVAFPDRPVKPQNVGQTRPTRNPQERVGRIPADSPRRRPIYL